MSNPRFVISVRNLDKCEPDNYYYCGSKSPIAYLDACVKQDEVSLDGDVECAMTLNSLETAAHVYGLLKNLGFEGVTVFQKVSSYVKMESPTFDKMVTERRVLSIMKGLDEDDIKYLQENGVLDLTIVT